MTKTTNIKESKMKNKIEFFLNKFPKNATSWAKATDEIVCSLGKRIRVIGVFRKLIPA